MLRAARDFFYVRDIMEVDCPLVSSRASVDTHIDLVAADKNRFLHSSPEYGMKRLISDGAGDIFQLSHVFRKGEIGKSHNPEFMMAEWYRLEVEFLTMIEETTAFIKLFVGELPCVQMTYRDVFLQHTEIDPASVTKESLQSYCEQQAVETYPEIEEEGMDGYLNLILGAVIEPKLGHDHLLVVTHYPASQAALAKRTIIDDFEVAERFEVYLNGVELANGYHELADAAEQYQRLVDANSRRVKLGKSSLPIDTYFIEALNRGFPDCCGVAVGFDRCMMLRHGIDRISDIIPFDWDQA